jgi:porin
MATLRVSKAWRQFVVSRRAGIGTAVALMAVGIALGAPASATPPPPSAVPQPVATGEPNPAATGSPAPQAGQGGFFKGIRKRDELFGDLFGLRTALSRYGISLSASETSEELGNVTGGTKQSFAYDGLTQAVLQLDTQRAFGLYGGTFNVSALQIHGSNLSANNLATLQTASGIEADRATRLWELWYQQQLLPEDKLDVKIGQQSLDQEFMVNQTGALFVNTMFGWPMLPSADLPGGGPAYPLSALGIRVRARPAPGIAVLAGAFNGNPAPTTSGDPQMANPSGTSFPLNGGLMAIAEVQFSYPTLGGLSYADRPEPLARTAKLGAWYNTETFDDLAVDTNGVPLASPSSNGLPRQHRGNYAIYATLDQLLFQDANDPFKTLNGFVRVMGTPLGDQNLIALSMNAGLALHKPIPHRQDDTLGIGVGYTQVGSGAAASDAATGLYGSTFTPVRNGEAYVELTYQYTVFPWLQLQPDFQYVFNPGAGVANPTMPFQRIQNEAVIGLRTIIQL